MVPSSPVGRTCVVILRALLIAAVAMWLGFLGASAFNPEDGYLLQSEPLWTVFGLAAYIGMFLLYSLLCGIPIYALTRFIARRLGRGCRSGVTSPP